MDKKTKHNSVLKQVETNIERDFGLTDLAASLDMENVDAEPREVLCETQIDSDLRSIIDKLFTHYGVLSTFNAIADVLGKLPPSQAVNYDAWEWLSQNLNRLVNTMHENNRKVKKIKGFYPFGCPTAGLGVKK